MNYKGYIARVLYDGEEKVLRGRVAGIDDLVTFEARSVDELEREFHLSVDEYLSFCAEQRSDPQEPRPNPARMVDTERPWPPDAIQLHTGASPRPPRLRLPGGAERCPYPAARLYSPVL